jgi:hypothetical protein
MNTAFRANLLPPCWRKNWGGKRETCWLKHVTFLRCLLTESSMQVSWSPVSVTNSVLAARSAVVHYLRADLILFFYIILSIQIRSLTRNSPPKFCTHVWFLLSVLNSMLNIANQISRPQQYYVADIYHLISRHIDLLFPIFENEEPVGCSVLLSYSRGYGFDSRSRFSLYLSFSFVVPRKSWHRSSESSTVHDCYLSNL